MSRRGTDFDEDFAPIEDFFHTKRKRHGLSPRAIDGLIAAQKNRCAGCGTDDPGQESWSVDHDHRHCPGPVSCGKCVRGLLCSKCNSAIAYARDNPVVLEALAGYLKAYEARRVV